jgi:hypothetical protein
MDSGSEWRACVDAAILAFRGIHGAGAPHAEPRPPSDLLAGVAACRAKLAALNRAAAAAGTDAAGAQRARAAARRLGVHYLMRYFFLICYRAFRADKEAAARRRCGEAAAEGLGSFRAWFEGRKELSHLLHTCEM